MYTPICRGGEAWKYAITSDIRLIENDFKSLVYEYTSEYQRISILNSPKNGNVLFLDGDVSK